MRVFEKVPFAQWAVNTVFVVTLGTLSTVISSSLAGYAFARFRFPAKNGLFLAILGSQMPMIFVIGGLAGLTIAPSPALATLSISLVVFGSMTTAPWLSALMQRFGRRAGFFVGAIGGLAGSAIATVAMMEGSFWLLLVGSWFTGIYMSAQGFYRFAAADTDMIITTGGSLITILIGFFLHHPDGTRNMEQKTKNQKADNIFFIVTPPFSPWV